MNVADPSPAVVTVAVPSSEPPVTVTTTPARATGCPAASRSCTTGCGESRSRFRAVPGGAVVRPSATAAAWSGPEPPSDPPHAAHARTVARTIAVRVEPLRCMTTSASQARSTLHAKSTLTIAQALARAPARLDASGVGQADR